MSSGTPCGSLIDSSNCILYSIFLNDALKILSTFNYPNTSMIKKVGRKKKIHWERAFRVKLTISKKLTKCKEKIAKRARRCHWEIQPKPMLTCPNIIYGVDGRNHGIANGGIGIFHHLVKIEGITSG